MHSGIIVLNKPAQMSSQQAVTRVKRALGAKKAGHAGTLDPDVTGVLPVFLGFATRLTEYILADGKRYQAELVLGWSTDTQDASGEMIESADHVSVSEQQIRDIISSFVGLIWQTPPAFSALKVQGKRAYELARDGIEVHLASRQITIYSLEILSISHVGKTIHVNFDVHCSKGTYIRTLCHDIGSALGIPAHMGKLVRTASGPFDIQQAHDIDSVYDRTWDLVVAPEKAILHMPALFVSEETLKTIVYGQPIRYPMDGSGWRSIKGVHVPLQSLVRVHVESGPLVAIYEVHEMNQEECILIPKKVLWQAVTE